MDHDQNNFLAAPDVPPHAAPDVPLAPPAIPIAPDAPPPDAPDTVLKVRAANVPGEAIGQNLDDLRARLDALRGPRGGKRKSKKSRKSMRRKRSKQNKNKRKRSRKH